MYQIFLLVASVVLLLVLISKVKLHTFLSLLIISLFLGIAGGIPIYRLPGEIATGFGSVMQGIGIIIVVGIIIGEILEATGGAKVIANAILRLVGTKRSTIATAVTGGVVSIPVFCDAGFVVLNPAIKAMSKAAKIPYMCLVSALMMGLLTTHSLVPPTPGPIAAAGILGADVGIVMIYGILISIPVLVITSLWCNSGYLRRKYPEIADDNTADEGTVDSTAETTDVGEGTVDNTAETTDAGEVTADSVAESINKSLGGSDTAPSLFLSVIPILIPIILILTRSFSRLYASGEEAWFPFVEFFGESYIALLVGVGLAFLVPKSLTREVTDTWVSRAIKKSAEIVLITGIAGSFGLILRTIGVGDILAELIAAYNIPSILLPFIVSAVVLMAQGSATVALLTTSGIIYPLLPALGISPELAVISIAGGSFTGVFPQGSYFWAVTKIAGYDIKKGYVAVTLTTFVMGGVALVSIFVLSLFVS